MQQLPVGYIYAQQASQEIDQGPRHQVEQWLAQNGWDDDAKLVSSRNLARLAAYISNSEWPTIPADTLLDSWIEFDGFGEDEEINGI